MNWIFLVIGVAIGIVLSLIVFKTVKVSGYMRINRSNPEKDLYSLEVGCDLNMLASKKWIVLKVIKED